MTTSLDTSHTSKKQGLSKKKPKIYVTNHRVAVSSYIAATYIYPDNEA